jgi:hypothetical protein
MVWGFQTIILPNNFTNNCMREIGRLDQRPSFFLSASDRLNSFANCCRLASETSSANLIELLEIKPENVVAETTLVLHMPPG